MRILVQVLDGTYGKPAVGVRADLARANDGGWIVVAKAETNRDGCVKDWDKRYLDRGLYRIVFDSDSYFAGLGAISAYPEVAVSFRILEEALAFQLQLTLAPYSYQTYFGTVEDHSGQLDYRSRA